MAEAAAWTRVRESAGGPAIPKAIDLSQFEGRLGYKFFLEDGRTYWVDAESGALRGELAPDAGPVRR